MYDKYTIYSWLFRSNSSLVFPIRIIHVIGDSLSEVDFLKPTKLNKSEIFIKDIGLKIFSKKFKKKS